ncbi:ATP-binding protein [Actinomadura sp. 6K520]|uniref:sensor histidine kinase n=1 Tax=Actinomadura sp. 6K520 TaxID=2530364 RepID=UPI001FB71407|nr:ATP-binding protein [Actinomadura sp. 6K520]
MTTLYSDDAVDRETRLILAMVAVGAAVTLLAAVAGAESASRRLARRHAREHEQLRRRLGELGFLVARGRRDLRRLTAGLRAGETAKPCREDFPAPEGDDSVAQLAYELQRAQAAAWNAVVSAARREPAAESGRRVDVFVNLARRMQTLSHRAIQGLDELENQVEDPDLLKGLFKVDHLTTRTRRQAESLAVIGGASSRRRWTRPVTVYEVLRSAIAEVEQYNRVKVVPPADGHLHGGAVADVVHLLAELIENATRFSPPQTQVLIRVERVSAGLAIEVEDRGLGIPRGEQRRLNALLADEDRGDTHDLLKDGRIGLLVVSALARRHKIRVQLQGNVFGGTQAIVVVPAELDGGQPEDAGEQPRPSPASAPRPEPAPEERGAPEEPPPARPEAEQLPRPAEPPVLPAGERPPLPRRQAQTHLAPELADVPAPALEEEEEDREVVHNSGLMAAFQRGMRSAREEGISAEEPDSVN